MPVVIDHQGVRRIARANINHSLVNPEDLINSAARTWMYTTIVGEGCHIQCI